MNYTCYSVENFVSTSLNDDINNLVTNAFTNNQFLIPMPGSCGDGINNSNLSPENLKIVTEQNDICKSKKNNKAYISILDYINKSIIHLITKYMKNYVNNAIAVHLLGKNQYGIFTSLNIPKDFTLPAEENAATALVSQFIDSRFGSFCCEAINTKNCDRNSCRRNIVLTTIRNTIDTPSAFYQKQIRINLIKNLPDLFNESNTPSDFTKILVETTPTPGVITQTPMITTPRVKTIDDVLNIGKASAAIIHFKENKNFCCEDIDPKNCDRASCERNKVLLDIKKIIDIPSQIVQQEIRRILINELPNLFNEYTSIDFTKITEVITTPLVTTTPVVTTTPRFTTTQVSTTTPYVGITIPIHTSVPGNITIPIVTLPVLPNQNIFFQYLYYFIALFILIIIIIIYFLTKSNDDDN